MLFGSWLAIAKLSALTLATWPMAAASTTTFTNPRRRDTTVPEARMALALPIPGAAGTGCGSVTAGFPVVRHGDLLIRIRVRDILRVVVGGALGSRLTTLGHVAPDSETEHRDQQRSDAQSDQGLPLCLHVDVDKGWCRDRCAGDARKRYPKFDIAVRDGLHRDPGPGLRVRFDDEWHLVVHDVKD